MPASTARRIAAIDSASSTGPHPNRHGPPIAQVPSPRRVNAAPERPSLAVGTIVRLLLIVDLAVARLSARERAASSFHHDSCTNHRARPRSRSLVLV